jgi:hypothetical protein
MIECLHRPRYKLAWISHNFPTHKHVFLERSPNPHWLVHRTIVISTVTPSLHLFHSCVGHLLTLLRYRGNTTMTHHPIVAQALYYCIVAIVQRHNQGNLKHVTVSEIRQFQNTIQTFHILMFSIWCKTLSCSPYRIG